MEDNNTSSKTKQEVVIMKDIQIKFMFSAPQELLDRVKRLADSKYLSVSAIIKQALIKYLEGDE